MSDKLTISCRDNQVHLGGELSFASVTDARADWLDQCDPHRGPIVLDLSEIGRIDSAGLALLVGWMKAAQEKGGTIRYTHLPDALLGMADVYGIQALFRTHDE